MRHPWVQNLFDPCFQKISYRFVCNKRGLEQWKNNTHMIYHDLPSSWKVDRSWFDDEPVNINTSPPDMCSSKHQTKKHLQFNSPSIIIIEHCQNMFDSPFKSINIMFILKICKDHVNIHQGNPPKKVLIRPRIRIALAPRRGCGADGRPGAGHSAADGGGLATSQCMEVSR